MANVAVTIGSTVEVSSVEPEFHGSWYVATVEDDLEASTKTGSYTRESYKRYIPKTNRKTSKLKKTGSFVLVKYATLVTENNEQLTEAVDRSFVRPLPPRNIHRNVDDNAKEAEVVEGDGGGDFELYDVVDAFNRDGWWLGVVKTVVFEGEMKKYIVAFEHQDEEFEFKKSELRLHVDWVDRRWFVPPKKTPERNASDDAQSGFTTPSEGTVVTHVDNVADSPALSANKNTRSRTQSETTLQTYGRNRRKVCSVEDGSGRKRLRSSAGGKENRKAIVSVLETSRSDDIHQNSPPKEHAINITQTCEAEDGKRGRNTKSEVNKPIGLVEDGNEVTIDDELPPLSALCQGLPSVLKRSSCFSPPDKSLNQAIVASGAGTTTTDNQQNWPFIKQSPLWVTLESNELYQKPLQKPHFLPLNNTKKVFREGLAIALMVTFENLVQSLSSLKLNDPVDNINADLESLCELETHGFDIGPIRGRLNELLALKSQMGLHEYRRKEAEKELETHNSAKSLVEKEMDRLKAEMRVLEEKTVQAAAVQKAEEDEVVRLQTNLDLVSKQANDLGVAFEELRKKGLTSS